MRVDLDYLRRQYTSLSDEALLAIDRDELVEAAQQCYDAEINGRGLTTKFAPAEKKRPSRHTLLSAMAKSPIGFPTRWKCILPT